MPGFEEIVAAASAKATEIRRIVHMDPELSWQEVRTTARFAAELDRAGIKILKKGFKGTESGIVAEIEGALPGPVFALRGDIDALPIIENPEHAICSRNEGVMHACGHDVHGSALLGTALALNELKNQIHGKVRFVFQPAEEAGFDSGAPAIIAEGGIDGVSAIVGTHVATELPMGVIGWRKGPVCASGAVWELTLTGKGGHGGRPHETVNPAYCMASMVPAIQNIVASEISTMEQVVVTVASIHTGKAPNVIPQVCTANGNVRTSNQDIRNSMPERFERITTNIAAAWRCKADLKYSQLYPVTVNNPDLTEWVCGVAAKAGFAENLTEIPFGMGCEDFSYYGLIIPATFVRLGVGTAFPHHSPDFIIDERVIPLSVKLQTELALDYGKCH